MDVPGKLVLEPNITGKITVVPGERLASLDSDTEGQDEFHNSVIDHVVSPRPPPDGLNAIDIGEVERKRFIRDAMFETSLAAGDSPRKDMVTSYGGHLSGSDMLQNNDPVCLTRQIRHLHNRVKLLENEMQTQRDRSLVLMCVISLYLVKVGLSMLYR